MLHFEELWEKCESFHKENCQDDSAPSILEELEAKVALYKAIEDKKEILKEDLLIIKSRTMGEILLTLTNLSLRDNINVYESLVSALQFREVEIYSKKYSE